MGQQESLSPVAKRIFDLADKKFAEQKDFAAAIGKSVSIVSQWRNGITKSYRAHLADIAAALGTSVEYLLTGTDRTDHYANFLMPEDISILRQIHDRPGLRIMFDLSAKASDEDIAKAVDILKAYYGITEDKP